MSHQKHLSLPLPRPCSGIEDSSELLRQYCNDRRMPVNQELLKGCGLLRLRKLEVDVCLDKMCDKDVKAVAAVLPAVTLLTRIQLYGKHFVAVAAKCPIAQARDEPGGCIPPNDPLRMKLTKERPNMWNKSSSDAHIDPGTVRLSRRPELINPLLRSLSRHLSTNMSLVDLRLIGLKISPEGWKMLAGGLRANSSVEYVSLVYCKISDTDLETLSPALESLPALRKLDLSNNSLAHRAGFLIGRIVSMHSYRKDDSLWTASLRRREWDSDTSDPVLSELGLANNHLDDYAVTDICRVLCMDGWLKTIDLRRNDVGVHTVKELCSVLRSNSSLVVVDLRETPVDCRKELADIVAKLQQNLARTAEYLSPRTYANYRLRLQKLWRASPPAAASHSAPASKKPTPRRSLQSQNSTSCCSPPSSLPSKSLKIDLKISRRASASTRSLATMSSTQYQTTGNSPKSATLERISQLEGLVSELTTLLGCLGEDLGRPQPPQK